MRRSPFVFYIMRNRKEAITMGTALEKEWKRILEKEGKMLFSAENKKETKLDGKIKEMRGKIEEKIPAKLEATLEAAFYKAFLLIFEKGTAVIEKTFKGEELQLEFQVNDETFFAETGIGGKEKQTAEFCGNDCRRNWAGGVRHWDPGHSCFSGHVIEGVV